MKILPSLLAFNFESFYTAIDKYKILIDNLSIIQERKKRYFVIFKNFAVNKKESLVFDSLEIIDEGGDSSQPEYSSYFTLLNPSQNKRIASSIAEQFDDLKRFDLKPRSTSPLQ